MDVLIVGGGVIGLTTAYELAGRGATVAVIERGDIGRESSWAGAGIIAPGNPTKAVIAIDRLRAESAAAFPALVQELREITGVDVGYRVGGFEYGDGAVFEDVLHEALSVDDIRDRDPGVEPDVAGWWFPTMAQVRNPRFVRALAAACEHRRARLIPQSPVLEFQMDGDRIIAAVTLDRRWAAGEYLVASGAWTAKLVPSPVTPLRGQMLLYENVPGPRFIHEVGKQYLVPRGDGRLLVGSTEENVGFDKVTTEAGLAQLRAFAESFYPALRSHRPVMSWAGLRPATPDGLPILGRVPGYANLSVAAGHLRTGIQNSPATGRALAELLTQTEPFIPLDDFSPRRFPRQGPGEIAKIEG